MQSMVAEVSVNIGSATVTASDSLLSVQSGGSSKQWKRLQITELGSRKRGGLFPTATMFVRLGDSTEDVVSGRESDILAALETMAAALYVRFEEHTGRSVEADEHGMNVPNQLKTFPSRWPRPQRLPSMEVEFKKADDGFELQLPSTITPMFWALYLGSNSVALLLALSFSLFNLGGINPALVLLPLLVLVHGIWYVVNGQTNVLENNHTVRITSTEIVVQGRILNTMAGQPVRYPLDEFRDLDVTTQGRLAFLFSDRRLSCDIPRLEGEWVVGEVAHRLLEMFAGDEETE